MEPTTTKSDPVRRALRGLFQVGFVTLAIQGFNLFSSRPLTADQTAWITAFGTFLVSLVQNALEEAGAVPTMLKGKPDAPLPDADRRFAAVAAAIGGQHTDIEDLRAELRNGRPQSEPRVFIRREEPVPFQW